MAAVTKERVWRLRQEFRTQTEQRRRRDYAEAIAVTHVQNTLGMQRCASHATRNTDTKVNSVK